MSLSSELQMGKAGEHLVCADLIMQGYNAFLADQGLPFDLVVDSPCGLQRVQVKTTSVFKVYEKRPGKAHANPSVFRFSLRRGVGHNRAISPEAVDVFAFVTLTTKQIAYFKTAELMRAGRLITLVELRTRAAEYFGRTYSNGTVRNRYGRFIEDFSKVEL